MAEAATTRRRIVRRFAISAVAVVGLSGALAAPASAATSQAYGTMAQCRSAQVAYGASSFVRITRSCYQGAYKTASGVWILDAYMFEYTSRTR